MKKLSSFVVAAFALMALTACNFRISNAGWSFSSLKASTNMVQSAAIPGGVKNLEVVNAFGSVRVTGSDTASAEWSQNLTVRARNEERLQEIATNFVCKAELDGDHLKLVVTDMDSNGSHHSFESDLEITVPRSVTVQTHNRYGRTEISDLSGDVEAYSQFGAMELRDIGGKVRAETSYAAMHVNNTGAAILRNQFGVLEAADIHGPLEATTSYATLDAHDIGGTVKLRNQFGRLNVEKAGEADVKTSYGELRANEIKGDARIVNQFGRVAADAISGSINATTSYGPMEITGAGTNFVCDNQFGGISVQATSPALANLEARTSYASLEVRLPSGLKPSVQAHTTYGDIESDFPVGGQQPGAASVNLRNQNGKIRVVRE
jgi:hypothetical protein